MVFICDRWVIKNGELLAPNVQLLERYVFSILFFPEAGSIIFQYLENFAFHVNGNRHNLLIFLVVFFACFICMFV